MSTFAITPALKQAVEHRIEELEHAKELFTRRHHLNSDRSAEPNVIARITTLLTEVENVCPKLEDGIGEWTSHTIRRFIGQAQDDKSISEARLLNLEKRLWIKLNKHLKRMEVSCLHASLMREVMTANVSIEKAAATWQETSSTDNDFEIVDEELEELFEEYKKDILTAPNDVDPEAIQAYLSSMFTGDEEATHLKSIRYKMQTYGNELTNENMEIHQDGLTWAITDLINNDSICPQTTETLETYLRSPIALQELVATLKMKAFCNWNYKDAEAGLSLTACKDVEGQYSVVVEEGIIDMLFLHCVAIGWASNLQQCLKESPSPTNIFVFTPLAPSERDKLSYFLNSRMPKNDLHSMCPPFNTYGIPVPPPPAPPMVPYVMPPPPPPPVSPSTNALFQRKSRKQWHWPMVHHSQPIFGELNNERKTRYIRDFFMWRLPERGGRTPMITPRDVAQANLIKTLAVELKLRETFDGEIHATVREFDSLASSIPHNTIIAVLKFLGVPEACLDLFTTFLETKLNVGPDKGLKRMRGVPAGHGMGLFFSEAVLFFLELAIHRKTGSFMYRLDDRCYFVGTREQVKAADEEFTRFSEIMGLKMHDTGATGALSIGFLTMDLQLPSLKGTATTAFKIDDEKVTEYAYRMKTKLSACSTVLEWVSIWNDTVGAYAAHLFGPLAHVFGKAHLEAVKAAYSRIHSVIFDGSDLTTHVKTLLSNHVKGHLSDSPLAVEAFIYLPQAYGGLGVKNVFVTLSFSHEMYENPSTEIEKYLADEDKYYTSIAQSYALLTPEERRQRLEDIFGNDTMEMITTFGLDANFNLHTPIPFIGKLDLVKSREHVAYPQLSLPCIAPSLTQLYHDLLKEPSDPIYSGQKSAGELRCPSPIVYMHSWEITSDEDKWVLDMYRDECFERYGTLEIWWAEGVPVEVYKTLKGYRTGGFHKFVDEV